MILTEIGAIERKKVEAALENVIKITGRNIIKFQDCFPSGETINGTYRYYRLIQDPFVWKPGFWCGIVWLMYEINTDPKIKYYGERLTRFVQSILNSRELVHSDIGFLTIPSCIANYKLTRSSSAKEASVQAANSLLMKYNQVNHFMQTYDSEIEGNIISNKISTILSLRLLSNAYQFTGNEKYREAEEKNRDMIIKNNINNNGKTYFRRFFNKNTGERIEPDKNFHIRVDYGEETNSYSWALYGLAVAYTVSKDEYYLKIFDNVINYLENNSHKGDIYRKKITGEEKLSPYDLRASVIIAGAIVQLLKNDEIKNMHYTEIASRITNAIIDNYSVDSRSNFEGLMYDVSHIDGRNSTEATSCGDYFYFELLMNLMYDRESYWY